MAKPLPKIDPLKLKGWLEGGLSERRSLEFKPPFSWRAPAPADAWAMETTIRAVLGMTNTATGGAIILGIESKEGVHSLVGLDPSQLSTFEDLETLRDMVDGYSTLATDFAVSTGSWEGLELVVLEVSEFSRRPVLCRKDGSSKGILRKGDLYVRSLKGRPATIRMTELELEEIIGLALSKEYRTRRTQGWHPPTEEAETSVSDSYLATLKDLG